MTIFFFLGALSGAPFGLPRFLGVGSTCGFSETASSFSGIVSVVSGIVSIVSAIFTLLNIFSINQKNKADIGHNCEDIVISISQLKGQTLRGHGWQVKVCVV
jgi:tetrahydromethanopterin S-methyltransferase subunit E